MASASLLILLVQNERKPLKANLFKLEWKFICGKTLKQNWSVESKSKSQFHVLSGFK